MSDAPSPKKEEPARFLWLLRPPQTIERSTERVILLVGAALDNDQVFTEVVCDGVHIHPAVISTIITAKGADAHGGYFLALRDGGDLLVWCAQAPKQVLVDEEPADFTYTAASGALQVAVPVGQGGHVLRIGL